MNWLLVNIILIRLIIEVLYKFLFKKMFLYKIMF